MAEPGGLLALAAVTADDGVEITPAVFEFVRSPWDYSAVWMVEYAVRTALTKVVTIPGSGSRDAALPRRRVKIRIPRPALILLLRRWLDCIRALHRADYSLRGNFTAMSFVVSAGVQVKLAPAGGIRLAAFTSDLGGLDYVSLANSVQEILKLREDIPPHTQVWLDLMRREGLASEYLLRYHTSLMEYKQAFQFVLEGRRVLERMRLTDPGGYEIVLTAHSQLIDWNVDSECLNSYMHAARMYEDPRTGRPFAFPGDLTGVLTLARNCHEHPARHLADFMVLILEQDFPGLVALFQESLFRVKALPGFHLELSMG